jgi:tyrosyl-tRNA synthetase
MFFRGARSVSADEEKIEELLTRGVAEVLPSKESLKKLLLSGKQLRVKLGIDPTGANLHLGNTVPLLKLRDFQELGHTVVFIIGDATGVIGDTSDKESERSMLSTREVTDNLASYTQQVSKILDPRQLEVRRNSEWLLKLNYRDIGEHAELFSVSDFIDRDNIKRRLDTGKRVSLREVLYPLMQGYDSVAVKADIELGGSDQRFNLLAGRPLQQKYGQAPQHCLMFSLMPGTDGEKMSKSRGNVINVFDGPTNMFGKAMSIHDSIVEAFFVSATRVPITKVKEILAGHPKDAKVALAEEIVRMYHGVDEAKKARTEFENMFAHGGVPDNAPTIVLAGRELADALVAAGIVKSKGEYRRLDEAGAITTVSEDAHGKVLRIGKHRFVKITL